MIAPVAPSPWFLTRSNALRNTERWSPNSGDIFSDCCFALAIGNPRIIIAYHTKPIQQRTYYFFSLFPKFRVKDIAYRITEKIGRWSMIDVFVVAVLVALVRAGALMAIEPGPAALCFAAVVIITMVAAHTFDTRRLWGATFERDCP